MAHISELSASLQAALNKPICGPIRVECILDPDGLNVDLSNYIDANGSIRISKRKSIFPYGSMGQFSAGEVTIRMINPSRYFDPLNIDSPFYYYSSRLYEAADSADLVIKIQPGAGDYFQQTQRIVVREVEKSGSAVITLVEQFALYDALYLGAGLGEDFSAGALVEIYPVTGLPVVLKNSVEGSEDKITQFVGNLKSLPKIHADYAEITLYDRFKEILDINLRANTYLRIVDSNGETESTLEYTRADDQNPSTGELDMDGVQLSVIAAKTPIGLWEVEFSSPEDFVILDPYGQKTPGEVSSNVTVYSGNQGILQISSAAWSGEFVRGDALSFRTVCSFGNGVNDYTTIPLILKALLEEIYAGNLEAADLDGSFDDLITDLDEERGAITFSEPISILKAVELLQQHINACVFITNEGKFAVIVFRPLPAPGSPGELSPEADIRELEYEDLGRIEGMTGKYSFNSAERTYGRTVNTGSYFSARSNPITINFPAYHDSDRPQARSAISRAVRTWNRGQRAYSIKEKFNFGIAFDLNDVFEISSLYPALAARNIELYEISKDILRHEVECVGYDLEYQAGNYCFTEVDYTDAGKVTW